ncbi:MAG: FkbM family methyltransferase [Planctomycetota bacterium]|nr:FkbM family methyltransferase [Planctomycetota bacterium]
MRLRLSNWSERHTYFLGRYYDLPTQLLMRSLVQQGDRFIDVGANIGMISLLASRLVGLKGVVESVEPNPKCSERIEEAIRENGIKNILIHRVGLSDCSGTAEMSIVTDHTGMGTFAPIPAHEETLVTEKFEATITTGDKLFMQSSQAPIMIKIDVEGLELRVLRGCREFIDRTSPAITTECIPNHLARDGVTVDDLTHWFSDLGYRGYALTSDRVGLKHRVRIFSMQEKHNIDITDMVWLREASAAHRRLVDGGFLRELNKVAL